MAITGMGTARVVALGLGILAGMLPSAALAQTGSVVGRVTSAETGEPLGGVHIQVEGHDAGTVSNTDGRYVIRSVEAGARSLLVQMMGFAIRAITIEVTPGKPTVSDIALVPEAVALEALTVTTALARGSSTALINERQRAAGMVDAIGSQQIGRSGDSDAADAIKRVSGVSVQDGRYVFVRGLGERYTTASLNGARIPSPEPERRVVPLDLFPTGLLESITTSKTFTPDQSGDFSGAQINLRTRDFPLQRQVTLSTSVGYNAAVTGRSWIAPPVEALDWLAMGAGSRAIPGRVDNFVSASRGPELDDLVGLFRNEWSGQQADAPPSASFAISMGGREALLDQEIGYLISGTYSAGAEAVLDQRRALAGASGTEYNRYDGESGRYRVLLGGLANIGTTLGERTRIELNNSYNRTADNEARVEVGTDEDTGARLRIDRLQYTERTIRSNQLRVEHEIAQRHTLRWSGSSSGVGRYEPDQSEFVTWLDPEVPIWFKHEEGAMRSFGRLDESNYETGVDYELRLGPLSSPHRLMAGGQYRTTDRSATSQVFRIQPFEWSPSDPQWQGNPEEMFEPASSEASDGRFLLSRDRSGGGYDASDRITAGYLMADVGLGSRVRMVGGARVERSELELGYESQLGSSGTTEPAYTDILPSLALNVTLTPTQQVRLSASRTLARPEYREIAPITYREVLGGEQVIGNSHLRRTLIRNYDVRWEWYPSYGEAVSVGVFAKEFSDPIEQRFLARSGTDTRTFENAESAFNYGVEMEFSRSLGFVAESLRLLDVFTNVTVMRSEVDTGRSDDEPRAMVGQAPYVFNGGLSWTQPESAYSGTLLYNVVGPRIVNARASGSQVDDVIEQSRPGLDLSLRFPLLGGVEGELDLQNLLDAPYELRQGEAVRQYHRVGRSASLGLTWRP